MNPHANHYSAAAARFLRGYRGNVARTIRAHQASTRALNRASIRQCRAVAGEPTGQPKERAGG